VIQSELSVISRIFGYGGTLDLLVKWLKKGTDRLGLLDIKSGSKIPVGTKYQTSAYRKAFCETAKVDKKLITTHGLLLTPEGKAQLETYKYPDTNFQIFLHYLGCYHAEVNEGIRKPWG